MSQVQTDPFRRVLRWLPVLGLGAIMATGPDPSEARPARPVVRLSCPAGAEALCRDLTQALAEAAGGSVIRRVAPGEEPPTRPGDIGLALRRETGVLQLLWYHPGDKTPHRGPWVTPVGAPAADAAALLQASPILRRALDRLRPATP